MKAPPELGWKKAPSQHAPGGTRPRRRRSILMTSLAAAGGTTPDDQSHTDSASRTAVEEEEEEDLSREDLARRDKQYKAAADHAVQISLSVSGVMIVLVFGPSLTSCFQHYAQQVSPGRYFNRSDCALLLHQTSNSNRTNITEHEVISSLNHTSATTSNSVHQYHSMHHPLGAYGGFAAGTILWGLIYIRFVAAICILGYLFATKRFHKTMKAYHGRWEVEKGFIRNPPGIRPKSPSFAIAIDPSNECTCKWVPLNVSYA